MQFRKAEKFIAVLLKQHLPSTLCYHDVKHTFDVLEAAVRIAGAEKISKSDLKLLKTAVLFHDCGFSQVYNHHEEAGCRLARAKLPDFGYNARQIEIICSIIMATQMPQTPHNLLEKIMCDADLDYLSRADFETISLKLYKEWRAMGLIKDEKEWYERQIGFLTAHHYWTETSIREKEPQKQKHLKEMRDRR
jgi:uncharacterized protein